MLTNQQATDFISYLDKMSEKKLKLKEDFKNLTKHYQEHENRKDFAQMAALEEILGVEIVSYGLAPRPDGYCYEIVYDEQMENPETTAEDGKVSDEYIFLWEHLNYLCDTAPEGYLN